MKTMKLPIVLSLLMVLIFTPLAYAVEASEVISDHQKMTATYEEKAAAQDVLIAEHEQMKKDYKRRFYLNDKVTPPGRIQKMETHCDVIISDASKLKQDLLEFARWHRMSAIELQGQ